MSANRRPPIRTLHNRQEHIYASVTLSLLPRRICRKVDIGKDWVLRVSHEQMPKERKPSHARNSDHHRIIMSQSDTAASASGDAGSPHTSSGSDICGKSSSSPPWLVSENARDSWDLHLHSTSLHTAKGAWHTTKIDFAAQNKS